MRRTAVLLLALIAGLGAARAELRLTIGTEGAYPPFNTRDDQGRLIGFDIDVMEAICARIDARCRWVIRDWDGLIPALIARDIDVIASSLPSNAETRRHTAVTRPYYRTPAAFATRREGGRDAIDPQRVDGLTLAGVSASVQGEWLLETLAERGARVRLFGTLDEAGTEVAEGRADGLFADKFAIDEWLRSNAEGACCRLVPEDVHDPRVAGEGAVFAVRPGDGELKQRLDSALLAIKADGTYTGIAARWFRFDPR